MAKHTKRKFKRNTESMPFLITCRAWRAFCDDKRKKKKVSLLNRKKIKEKRKTDKMTQRITLVLKKSE